MHCGGVTGSSHRLRGVAFVWLLCQRIGKVCSNCSQSSGDIHLLLLLFRAFPCFPVIVCSLELQIHLISVLIWHQKRKKNVHCGIQTALYKRCGIQRAVAAMKLNHTAAIWMWSAASASMKAACDSGSQWPSAFCFRLHVFQTNDGKPDSLRWTDSFIQLVSVIHSKESSMSLFDICRIAVACSLTKVSFIHVLVLGWNKLSAEYIWQNRKRIV